ncbi:hypothetical protein PoB_002171400 [Plakobranchus ocellatus]|uniref:Uncharacterized protein n=1 Tax=Plakobranchus ocellatus TaxID=259542 RepID=A0AAV3ZLG5_9GAST|nr:hypothetical protein PoB_002171400 [Plakobranchus ocellatus]
MSLSNPVPKSCALGPCCSHGAVSVKLSSKVPKRSAHVPLLFICFCQIQSLHMVSSVWGTTGRMEGKKSRGRQREKMLDGMTSWMGTKRVTDALSESWDRESWKDMIPNAKGQGT